MYSKISLFLIIIVFLVFLGEGKSSTIDSLFKLYKKANTDTTKIQRLLDIGVELRAISLDSSETIFNKALNISEKKESLILNSQT